MARLTPDPRVRISVCIGVQALIGPLSAGGTEADRAPLPLATERFLLGDSARGPHGPEPPSCDTPAPHGDVGGLYGGSGPKDLQCAPSAVAHFSATRNGRGIISMARPMAEARAGRIATAVDVMMSEEPFPKMIGWEYRHPRAVR